MRTKTRNTLLFRLLIAICLLNIVSCADKMEEDLPSPVDLSKTLATFEKHYNKNISEIMEWGSKQSNTIDQRSSVNHSSELISSDLINELREPSLDLLKDYGFTNDDFVEMFGSSEVSEIQDELVGSAIMIFNLQIGNYENSRSQVARETPEAVDCFLEATGVAAGIALVGALTGELGGKALKQAFKKAVKKIGSRFLGGVGLFLMAAEFTWCMTR